MAGGYTSIMVDIKARGKEFSEDFDGFKKNFGIPQKQEKLKLLTEESLDPQLWDDQNKARQVMQDLSDLKNELDEVESLDEEIQIISELTDTETNDDLFREIAKIESRLNKIKLKTYLSGTNDKKNATLSIHAGQGRTEAMDWVSMLTRLYLRFFERRLCKADLLHQTDEEA